MPTKQHKVQAVLDGISREVAELGQQQRRELLIALRRAEVELSVGLNKWLKEIPNRDATFTAAQFRLALRNTKEARKVLRGMKGQLSEGLGQVRIAASGLAVAHIEQQWIQLNSIFTGRYVPINIKAAAVLSSGNNLLLAKHRKLTSKYSKFVEQHIRRHLAVGLAKNESITAMVGRLSRLPRARLFEQGLDPAAAMANGLIQGPISNVERIVRTEAINAYNAYHTQATRQAFAEDDTVRRVWDATLDRRNRLCPICPGLDGQIRKPNEVFKFGGIDYDQPPAHPYCRCATVIWHEDWQHNSMQSTGTETLNKPTPKPIVKRRDERAPAK